MKTRTGFVSNSSSSSFLICLPAECTTFRKFLKEGIYHWLLPDEKKLDAPVEDYKTYIHDGKVITYRECLKTLWEHIKKAKTVDPEKVVNEWSKYDTQLETSIGGMGFYNDFQFVDIYCGPHNISNWWSEDHLERNKFVSKAEKIGKQWNRLMAKGLAREIKSTYGSCVYVGFSDNDGSYMALMEHGDFWKLVPHVKLSEH